MAFIEHKALGFYKDRGNGPDRALPELTQVSKNIQYFFSTPLDDPSLLRLLYLERGLSAREIAKKYGHSKSFVLDLLKKHSINRRPTHQHCFKTTIPPYGFKMYREKRCTDKSQSAVIKIILALRKQGVSLRQICNELALQNITTREGKRWHPQIIKRILDRYKIKKQ